MCGLVGIFNTESGQKASINMLEKMIKQINHRGPDDKGYYIDNDIALAHARLSIIDLSGGHQPMHNASKDVWVVFNGEVFNYIELREELINKGYHFSTNTDTEVIVHLYEEYGEYFVNYLNGQFAIALWDKKQKRLLFTRDRVGIVPLFYTFTKKSIVFASEIKSILPALETLPEIDPVSLDQIFTYWTTLSPKTIFKDIFEVMPGEILVYENKKLHKRTYWDWMFPENNIYHQGSIEILCEELKELLIDSTKIRLRSDVPVAAYLSGGLDSSVLISIVRNCTNASLKTFSIEFEDRELNESAYQRSVRRYLNTDHSSYLCEASDIYSNLQSVVWHTEKPILRSAPVPMSVLSALVHDAKYKVVLTGEGADEVLGGYDIFKEAKIRQFWAKDTNSKLRPLLLKRLYPYLEHSPGGLQRYAKIFFGKGLDDPGLSYFSHIPRWSTTSQIKYFYSASLKDRLQATAMSDIQSIFPEAINRWHPFNKSQYIEAKSLMSGYLLSSQGDRMLMKNSVEGRYPYLDYRVIDYVNRIDPNIKMKALNEKYLLKKSMGAGIPQEIVNRHKQPYRAPDLSVFKHKKSFDYIDVFLSHKKISDYGYFDPGKVILLLKKVNSGRAIGFKDSMALMGILSTQILHGQYVNDENRVFS